MTWMAEPGRQEEKQSRPDSCDMRDALLQCVQPARPTNARGSGAWRLRRPNPRSGTSCQAHNAPRSLAYRYVVLCSAALSLVGACVIIYSALRFRELSKRFFAIRLIFFLALTDAAAAVFNILGCGVDTFIPMEALSSIPLLCAVQAVGLLYFNLASIMWTSCFAFTLYRDVVPSSRRHALRKYEQNFHMLCWPLPALLVGGAVFLGYLSDAGTWCAVDELSHSREYLLCFYLPLLIAFTFNLITYTAVLSHSRERRVSRITSLYLLGFAIVWLPSLLCRLQVVLSPSHDPSYWLAALEALLMPLQGALNALVYGWSLPSIRDVYRTMLLGTDGLNSLQIADERNGGPDVNRSEYSPPTCSWPNLASYGACNGGGGGDTAYEYPPAVVTGADGGNGAANNGVAAPPR